MASGYFQQFQIAHSTISGSGSAGCRSLSIGTFKRQAFLRSKSYIHPSGSLRIFAEPSHCCLFNTALRANRSLFNEPIISERIASLGRAGALWPQENLEPSSWSGMAWAGATRQTAITVSRFVGGIFSAKGRDHRRKNTEWVSGKGTLGWFWHCFRVVTHYCHGTTIATQAQRRSSILLKVKFFPCVSSTISTHSLDIRCSHFPSARNTPQLFDPILLSLVSSIRVLLMGFAFKR